MIKFKFTSILIIYIVGIFILNGCTKSEKNTSQNDKQSTNQDKPKTDSVKLVENGKYVCPMHPTMQSNEPAKCPICKMNMVTKDELNKEMSEGHEKMEEKYAGKPNAIHFEVNLSVVKSTDCQAVIENELKNSPGILGYHTDILNRVVHLYFDKTKTSKDNIEKLISDAGFDANDKKANPEAVKNLPASCK